MSRPRKIVRTKRIYKKKSGNKKALGIILYVLLIVALVPLSFIVVREWDKRFGPNAPVQSMPSTSSIVSKPTSSDKTSSDDTSSAPEKDAVITDIKATYMPINVLQEQGSDQYKAYLEKIKADGYNSVYVQLKTEDGIIHFKTQNEMAVKYGAISEKAVDVNVLVKAIKDAGLTPIAQISALKDKKAPHVKNENSYAYDTNLNVNWFDDSADRGGKPWLNPYMDNARKYISDLTKELSSAGFNAIVLENVMFPDKNTGKMNTIKTTPSHAEILKQLLTEAQTAAGNIPVLQGANLEAYANVNAKGYDNNLNTVNYIGVAPNINMETIKSKLSEIKEGAGITTEGSTPQEAVKTLLQNILTKNGTDRFMPIVRGTDLAQIEPILKELNIKSYIVI